MGRESDSYAKSLVPANITERDAGLPVLALMVRRKVRKPDEPSNVDGSAIVVAHQPGYPDHLTMGEASGTSLLSSLSR